MTNSVILLILGCLALLASANGRRFDRSGSLTAQVRLDASQFENKPVGGGDDDDGDLANVDHEARIAAAIQAAVHVASPAATKAAAPYALFRLRVATQARKFTCAYPCGTGKFNQANVSVQVGWLQGLRVTVVTNQGSFSTRFDNSTVTCAGTTCTIHAPLNNNTFFYDLTATLTTGSSVTTFTLSTATSLPASQFAEQLNITSLLVETQAPNDANPRFGGSTFSLFSPTQGDFQNATSGVSADGLVKIVNGSAQYGCTPASIANPNPNFDGLLQEDYATIQNLGFTQFTVTPVGRAFLVNSFGNATLSFHIVGFNQVLPNDPSIAATYLQLGLENIPCTQRGNVLYDEVAVLTGSTSTIPELQDPFTNPTFYNGLVTATKTAKSNLGAFIRTVRLIAGRGQTELFDAILDRNPFSLLSHYSKFTPCFRVNADPKTSLSLLDIGVFIGFALKVTPKHATVVVGQLAAPLGGGLVNTSTNTIIPLNPDFTKRPQFTVNELVLANLVNPNANPAVPLPITVLLSDVSMLIDNCPAYSYFQ